MVDLLIKIAFTIVGILAIIKGINDGFVSSKSIEQASWIKLVLSLVFIVLGIFLIYFGDLFPPVTKFLRPFVLGILEFPDRFSNKIEHTARRNMYR